MGGDLGSPSPGRRIVAAEKVLTFGWPGHANCCCSFGFRFCVTGHTVHDSAGKIRKRKKNTEINIVEEQLFHLDLFGDRKGRK